MKPKFIMLCGIPGCGKSTYAKKLIEQCQENIQMNNIIVIHSSDDLREELYGTADDQDNNVDLFEELHRRVKTDLQNGVSVIYDATNINRKRRKHIINNILHKVECEKEIIYFSESYESAVLKSAKRTRDVPNHVIKNMFINMHIPQYEEGWDNIEIVLVSPIFSNTTKYNRYTYEYNLSKTVDGEYEETRETSKIVNIFNIENFKEFLGLADVLDIKDLVYNKPQNNPHHTLSIDRHTYKVYEYLKNNRGAYHNVMLYAALFHDTGKDFCRTTKPDTLYDQFIGHENVSAQIALDRLSRIYTIENQPRYTKDFILEVVDLVQNHMLYLNEQKLNKDKSNKKIDQEKIELLEILREADINGK